MNDEMIINKVRESLETVLLETSNPAPRRIFIRVNPSDLEKTVKFLKDQLGFSHLSTITGVDKTESFELMYHLANEFSVITVKVDVPRNAPKINTITAIVPGAILYERELQDMFGISVENIPDKRPLVLPDDWKQGDYPLRKDWKFQRTEEKIPGDKK